MPLVELTPCFLLNAHVQSLTTRIKILYLISGFQTDLLPFLNFLRSSSAATHVTCVLFFCRNTVGLGYFTLCHKCCPPQCCFSVLEQNIQLLLGWRGDVALDACVLEDCCIVCRSVLLKTDCIYHK